MFKMKCPICGIKMSDKTIITQYKTYECSNCKTILKVSMVYRIAWVISVFIGSIIASVAIDILNLSNTNIQKFITRPLIVGVSVGVMIFLVQLYTKKLIQKK